MTTPSMALAEKIIERLLMENLITDADAKRMVPQLAEGKLRPEDWRLPIELAVEKVAKQ